VDKIFDFNKITDFDEHISLSIPNYGQLFSIFVELTNIFSEFNTTIVDYGCSTGKLLNTITKKENCEYIGIDNSNLLPESDTVRFIKTDAITYTTNFNKPTSVVICMFFLQFLNKRNRALMLANLKEHLNDGAILLISEKIILDDNSLDNIISRLHIAEKRINFTDKEILDKDRQLLNCMYCKKESELLQELHTLGSVTKVWQSYNFCGYIVK
jgi:tRNA (cmo5U34)-methyltransferase